VSYVRLTRDPPPEDVVTELERWRPVLATRAEIARNPRRRWWETAWPRSVDDLRAPKVVGVHRTDRGRFAVDTAGVWEPGKNAVFAVSRDSQEPVEYLCGVLNSELLDLWFAVRGRNPRDVWRDYEPRPMNGMPYRKACADARAGEVAGHVRAIASNREALLRHRAAVRDFEQIIKDPWRTGPVEILDAALLLELPAAESVSLRLEVDLRTEISEPGRSRVVRSAPNELELRSGRRVRGRIVGTVERIEFLEMALGGKADDNVLDTLLPKDIAAFRQRAERRRGEVRALLSEGRDLVERVERLVCAIYDVPDDLTEQVVAHAVRRAG
jgi:hypothetical protein